MRSPDSKSQRTLNLNLQGLEVFCEVIRLQSFSRAAESLGITQSATSQAVANLEETLGIDLIDRSHRPLRPTPDGKVYHQGCLRLLHGHQQILERLLRTSSAGASSVRVVSIYSVGLHSLSRRVQRFMQEWPGATVRLQYLHPTKVYDAIDENEAELGVISYPKAGRHFEVTPWIEEEMVLACPPNHPLASRQSIRIRNLQGLRFVAFDADLGIRQQIDRTLKKHQVSVEVLSEFDNIETIKQALEISEAVSILPAPSFEREAERGTLVGVGLSDVEFRRPIGIVHRKRSPLSPTAERFVASLLAEANS